MTVANIPDDLANSPTPPGTAGPSSHLQSSTKAEGESFVFPGVAQSRRSTMGRQFFQQPEEDDWTIWFATAFASAMKANADQNMKDLSELINRDCEPRPPQIKATPPGKIQWTGPQPSSWLDCETGPLPTSCSAHHGPRQNQRCTTPPRRPGIRLLRAVPGS
ncbi:hypothetical protein ONZ45_g16277 [Pleurotus djamor]|nr:hypothetical protein ONZ45_g16277 [Pleurotus djamor]